MRKYNGFARVRISRVALLAVIVTACASRGGYEESSVKSLPETGPIPAASSPRREAPVDEAPKAPVAVRVEAPYRYVVKQGDTLWDIANHFMRDAWQWPEVWVVNPRVENPHLIYPGDVLYLYYKDGRPQIAKQEPALEVERVSPQVREHPLDEAIPAIPLDAIRTFLNGPRILSRRDFEQAPYVVEFQNEHVIAGSNTGIYAAKVPRGEAFVYAIVRRGQAYRDPDTNELIGWEAIPVGQAEVSRYDDPLTTLWVTESQREVRIGDRLVPVRAEEYESHFFPHAPGGPVGGRIISVFDGVSQIAQYQIVAINRGAMHGIEPGHVLAVYQTGRKVPDPYSGNRVKLPDEYAGTLMVFRVHPRLSYGLIMKAERAIHVLDRVDRPRLD